MSTIVYLLQVSACMGAFYGFYYFLLSRLTFFTINRWYLMVTLAFSFIVPLITIHVQPQYLPAIQGVFHLNQLQNVSAQQQYVIDAGQTIAQPHINWLTILTSIYLAIVGVLFIRLIIILAAFFVNIKGTSRTRMGYIHIIRGNRKLNNGSFLNYIFLNEDELKVDEIQQIIRHEMLHVKLLHSVDRIILKIIQIILWFNPFIYLYARSVEENHEFEVDREIGRSADKNKYADLLLHLSVSNRGVLYHSFSKVPLEKRINMLFNQPTQNMKKTIYVLVLPLVAISCLAFANLKPAEKESPANGSNLQSAIDTSSNGQKAISSPKRQTQAQFDSQVSSAPFYSRIHIQNADGKSFDKITFKLSDGSASANLGIEDKVGIFIDGDFYKEEDIKKLPAEKTASLSFDNSKNGFKPEKIPDGNYAVPFSFKTKSTHVVPGPATF